MLFYFRHFPALLCFEKRLPFYVVQIHEAFVEEYMSSFNKMVKVSNVQETEIGKTKMTFRTPSEQLFPNRQPLSFLTKYIKTYIRGWVRKFCHRCYNFVYRHDRLLYFK